VFLLLLLPPLKLRLHRLEELGLGAGDHLLGALLAVRAGGVSVSARGGGVLLLALLRAAALLQTQLPLARLQDLLPLGFPLKHLAEDDREEEEWRRSHACYFRSVCDVVNPVKSTTAGGHLVRRCDL